MTAAPTATTAWYRSRSFLVGAAIVVILAVTVITDLPAPATHASNVAAASTVITTINTDLAPCSFAVSEALNYEALVLVGRVDDAQRAQAPQLLNDDLIACSLVNSSVFDLSNIDVPGSASARQLRLHARRVDDLGRARRPRRDRRDSDVADPAQQLCRSRVAACRSRAHGTRPR